MKFDRTMKEWGMFGSLYELFKKCMMQKQQDKRQKNLWLQCVSYGQDYMDDNGIQSLSYELAYDLYDFAASVLLLIRIQQKKGCLLNFTHYVRSIGIQKRKIRITTGIIV